MVIVEVGDLHRAIKAVLPAACPYKTQPQLRGVRLQQLHEFLVAAAYNGSSAIAVARIQLRECSGLSWALDPSHPITIPLDQARQLQLWLWKLPRSSFVGLESTAESVEIKPILGDRRGAICDAAPEGFPSVKTILKRIPANPAHRFCVPKKGLASAIKAAKRQADESARGDLPSSVILKLFPSDSRKQGRVEALGYAGARFAPGFSVPATDLAVAGEIRLEPNLPLKALSGLSGNVATFKFDNPLNGIALEGKHSQIHLIMPIAHPWAGVKVSKFGFQAE